MPRKVFKYLLPGDDMVVEMPVAARIVSVGLDADAELAVWAEVDPDAVKVLRRIVTIGTGEEDVPEGGTYIGRTVSASGRMIWHTYDMGET